MKIPEPPSTLKPKGRGRAWWLEVTAALELDGHEQAIALEACRTLDLLDDLDELRRKHGLTTPDGRIASYVVEARVQRVVLSRLIAALRLPQDMTQPDRRPQRRAARGAYHPRGLYAVGGDA